jgi:hypothetical protein
LFALLEKKNKKQKTKKISSANDYRVCNKNRLLLIRERKKERNKERNAFSNYIMVLE